MSRRSSQLVSVVCASMASTVLGCGNAPRTTAPGRPVAEQQANAAHLVTSALVGSTGGGEGIRDVAIDAEGFVYLTGDTGDPEFPPAKGPSRRAHGGGQSDAFVVKLAPDGTLLWSAFLGGPSLDRTYALEVDPAGFVYVAGRAGQNFPTTPGVFQPTFMGGPPTGPYPAQDGFVAKFSPDGRLQWASYFGSADDTSDIIRDISLGADGDVFVATSSATGQYPPPILQAIDRGSRSRRAGERDSLVARVSADGRSVKWATYLGGTGQEWAEGSIRTARSGHVYFLTVTQSADMPVTDGAFDTSFNGGGDFYLAKLDGDGRLVFGTYVGGTKLEHVETHQLAVDPDDNPVIVAGTLSSDFPIPLSAYQPTYRGSGGSGTGARSNYPGDAVIARLSADGAHLVSATFLGGRHGESAEGAGIDGAGNIYVVGGTFSDDFPVTGDAVQSTPGGEADGFVARLSSDMTRLLASTYLGGSGFESLRTLAVDAAGRLVAGGDSASRDWPTFRPPSWGSRGGPRDAVLVRFDYARGDVARGAFRPAAGAIGRP